MEAEGGDIYESFGDPLCPLCGAILIDEEALSAFGGNYDVESQG